MGVAEVGGFERPALRLAIPMLPITEWLRIAELAFGLVVLVSAESWGSVRSLALANGDTVDANRELMVLGACNVGAALFQGMPVGAGLNRDQVLMIGAILAVLLFGVLHGMFAAIGLSLVAALRRFSQPVVHELGELGTSRHFVVLAAHPDASRIPGLLILRPEEPLFFANAERVVADLIGRLLVQREPAMREDTIRAVVLSLEESVDLDSTAVECLVELAQHLRHAGIVLVLSRAKDAVRELLSCWDLHGVGDASRIYFSVDDAVHSLTIEAF